MNIISPTTTRLRALERSFEEIRASRPIAARVVQLTDDPNTDARQVAEAIDADPMLTAQMLRLANSAAFGMQARVSSTQLAVSVLGFSAVRSIAVLLASGLRNHRQATPPGFWQHAAATAAASSLLARQFQVPKGDAFSLGLLHDLGAPLLYGVDQGAYAEMAVDNLDSTAACAEEVVLFGMSHAEAAARMLGNWNFPNEFVEAIASHHDATSGVTPHERLLVTANALAQRVIDPENLAELDSQRLDWLDVSDDGLDRLTEQTREEANEVLAGLAA